MTFRAALSVSPFAESLTTPGSGGGAARTVEEIARMFRDLGGTEVFHWLNTTRASRERVNDMSLQGAVARARLAAALGMPFNPELGLFGSYGDLRCQTPPDFREYPEIEPLPGWDEVTIDELCARVQAYTRIAAAEIVGTGARVDVWDIGNEVEFGVAGVAVRPIPGDPCADAEGNKDWYMPPDAIDPQIGAHDVLSVAAMPEAERIAWLQAHLWPHVAKVLAAAAAGIRDVQPGARVTTHMGLAIPSPSFATAFYRAMESGGFVADELGFSFYPSNLPGAGARLREALDTIAALHDEFRRPVFIAEYAYPAEPMREGVFVSWVNEVDGYPLSEDGQARLLEDLVAEGIPRGLGGIRPWAPDLAVGHWAPMSLFRPDGTARPSAGAIARGVERAGLDTAGIVR